jgi:hypothetical protein
MDLDTPQYKVLKSVFFLFFLRILYNKARLIFLGI